MGTGPGLGLRPPPKPRQEISRCLKYLLFGLNFVFLLFSLSAALLGAYIASLEWRPLGALADVFLNPAALLLLLGLATALVTLAGSMGALRENVCLLKTFALSLFASYITAVILAFILFVLFYSDSTKGVSITTFLHGAVQAYHDNPNYRDFLDYVQGQLECCGVTSLGYKDWAASPHFNCSQANGLPERCGVPYSCCRPEGTGTGPSATADLLRPIPRDAPVQCWRGAQKLSLGQLKDRIYTRGCLEPLQDAFEGHAVMAGAAIGAIIVPVCLSVMFANVLSKQIERQRYLLDREARKEQRRLRKAKLRIRDSFNRAFRRHRPVSAACDMVDETGEVCGPVEELRPERLAKERRKERRAPDRRSPANDSSSADYGGANSDDAGPSQSRQYQRTRRGEKRRSEDDMAQPIVPRRPREQAERRRRTRSLGQGSAPDVSQLPAGPAQDKAQRRRRKKSVPLGHYSSASTIQDSSSSSLPRPATFAAAFSAAPDPLPLPPRRKTSDFRQPVFHLS